MIFRITMVKRSLFIIILIGLTWASVLWGEEKKTLQPGPQDKCPVCGMFVHKYPDFVAGIVFKDGSTAFFDGVKDMFKYYQNISKYNPKKREADVESIYVTDYYDLTLMNGRKAYYVQGSDVYGPMGRELIPFEKEGEAKEFMKDHKGKRLFRFQEITGSIIKGLD